MSDEARNERSGAEGLVIAAARTEPDFAAVADLFRAYAASLDVDLGYQDFKAELASLPGKYAPPGGALLLARDAAGEPAGCVGLRALALPGCCEMKRLYVAPVGRGIGLGRRLAEAVIAEGSRLGYAQMRLDTLPSMGTALALYERLGFERTAPYYATAIAGTIYLTRRLGC